MWRQTEGKWAKWGGKRKLGEGVKVMRKASRQ